MKVKKSKKTKKFRGKGMGSHGRGFRKRGRGKGDKGGKGMSGSGKRADHKKTLITKLYGGNYFGKKGVTSIGTKRDKTKKINIGEIQINLDSYIKKGTARKTPKGIEINLKDHKILGYGEVSEKLIINAKSASKSAAEKVKESGGEIITK